MIDRSCRLTGGSSRPAPVYSARRGAASVAGVFGTIMGAILGFTAALPGVAQGACNTIPIAELPYPSTVGGVAGRLTTAGRTVEIVLNPACDVLPMGTSQGFEPVAADNTIKVTFEPSIGAPVAVGTVASAVSGCTLPGGLCTTLEFVMPATIAAAPPSGLAGPAIIEVTDPGSTSTALIDELFQQTSGCDREPDTVIEHFTVLPTPNVYQDLCDTPGTSCTGAATELLATLDGGGNLLIPFDFFDGGASSVLPSDPGDPVAVLVRGTSTDPDIAPIIVTLAANPDRSDFLSSYSLDGRPIHPLVTELDDSGEPYGTADAVGSVLRVAINDGAGGPDIYDLEPRLTLGGIGPIAITPLNIELQDPVPFVGLTGTADVVAFARSEFDEGTSLNADPDTLDRVVEILNPSDGIGTNTGLAVTEVERETLTFPALDTGAGVVAFLETENGQGPSDENMDGDTDDSILRVFEAPAVELTAPTNVAAAVGPLVNKRPFAISDGKVFARTPSAIIQRIGGVSTPTDVATSADGLHSYVVQATAGTSGGIGIFTRTAGGRLLPLLNVFNDTMGIAGMEGPQDATLSPDDAHLYVTASGGNSLNVFSRAASGLLTFVQSRANLAGPEPVMRLVDPSEVRISPDGNHLYVAAMAGAGSIVIFSRDPGTGMLTYIDSVQEGVGLVTGIDGINDLEVSPDGAHVYATGPNGGTIAVFSRDADLGTLVLVRIVTDNSAGVDGLDTVADLAITTDGRHVYAVSPTDAAISMFERDDFDGALTFVGIVPDSLTAPLFGASSISVSRDGARVYVTNPLAENVVVYRRARQTGRLTFVERYQSGFGGIGSLMGIMTGDLSPDGKTLYAASTADEVLAVAATSELVTFDAGLADFGSETPPARDVRVRDGLAAILTPEAYQGVDLNGDGDIDDLVASVLDFRDAPDVLFNTTVAADDVALSSDLLAIMIPELPNDKTDYNNDGDTDDAALAVVSIANPTKRKIRRIAVDAIGAVGTSVVVVTPESHENHKSPDGTDLNGDFDMVDRVLRVLPGGNPAKAFPLLTALTHPVAVADFETGESVVAFRIDEAADGAADRNGDTDFSDFIMAAIDLDSENRNVISSGRSAILCDFRGCDPKYPYKVIGNLIAFLTRESDQIGTPPGNSDLNDDGDTLDIVVSLFHVKSRKTVTISTFINDGSPPNNPVNPFPETLLDSGLVFTTIDETAIGIDVNGDGDMLDPGIVAVAGDSDGDQTFDAFDTCTVAANLRQLDGSGDRLGDQACDPTPDACPDTPAPGCKATGPNGSVLNLKAGEGDTDRLVWKWLRGDATILEDFADPVNDLPHYSLCVYDTASGSGPIAAMATFPDRTCGVRPCWKATGSRGFRYKDKEGKPSGITTAVLKTGATGRAKIIVKGSGPDLGLTPTPLPASPPVTVQLLMRVNDNLGPRQVCWESSFPAPRLNSAGKFSARGD